MSDFTTRPEILGTFGVVTSTHWLASATGMEISGKGRQRLRCRGGHRLCPAGRRAAPVRPGRRGADHSHRRRLGRRQGDLRPGDGAGGGDHRRLPRPGARPGAGLGAAGGSGAGRLRRLDAAAARPWHHAPRRRARPGHRLRRERLSGGPQHHQHDHRGARAVRDRMADLGRRLSPRRRPAGARHYLPQPGPCGDLRAPRRGGGRRRPGRRDRGGAPRLVAGLHRRGDRPLLPRDRGHGRLGANATGVFSPATTWPPGGPPTRSR